MEEGEEVMVKDTSQDKRPEAHTHMMRGMDTVEMGPDTHIQIPLDGEPEGEGEEGMNQLPENLEGIMQSTNRR